LAAIHAKRALALVGTSFRPQGRAVEEGLDCVGLCLAAFDLPSDMVRADYRLRGSYRAEAIHALLLRFRRVPRTQARPGDLQLLEVADNQLHLAVMTEFGFVHADARLRRVVETPGEPAWPLIGTYRRRRK
jgi:hypothetical protein